MHPRLSATHRPQVYDWLFVGQVSLTLLVMNIQNYCLPFRVTLGQQFDPSEPVFDPIETLRGGGVVTILSRLHKSVDRFATSKGQPNDDNPAAASRAADCFCGDFAG
jgi:hypothetical protein